jgi:hypothetical protein
MDRLVTQFKPMIHTIFPNNDAVFQDDSTEAVPSQFEGHEGEHLP